MSSIGQLLLVGVPGAELDAESAAFFKKLQPGGFILFGRNIKTPTQLRKLIDDLRGEFHAWRSKLEAVVTDVAEMKPTVDEMRTAQQRAIGALMMSRVLYAIGLALTGGVTWIFSNWIKITIR